MARIVALPPQKGVKTKGKQLNLKQDLFCKLYATDPECLGSATYAYKKAYGIENNNTAKTGGVQLLNKPEITARINEYLQLEGFNHENVDKQLLYVINQHRDLSTKVKGIQEYNKLMNRITNKLEIMLPKPILSLSEGDSDDDEEQPKVKTLKKDKDTGQYE